MKPIDINADIKMLGRRWRRKMQIKYIEWPELYDRLLSTKEIVDATKRLEPKVKEYLKEDYVRFVNVFASHYEAAFLGYYGPEAALHLKEYGLGYDYVMPAS